MAAKNDVMQAILLVACLHSCCMVNAGETPYDVNLRFEPTLPRANQTIQMLANNGGCDLFIHPDPLDRNIVVSGDVIRVTVPFRQDLFCIVPPATFVWDIGKFPAGTYRLELYGEDPEEFPRALLQAVDITIEPALAPPKPTVVPAMGRAGIFVLAGGFALIAALGFSAGRIRR